MLMKINLLGALVLTIILTIIPLQVRSTPSQSEKDVPQLIATGPDAVREVQKEMQAAGVASPGSDFRLLNKHGYQALYVDNDIEKALRYFHWNIVLFSNTDALADLLDSWAEAHVQAGNLNQAIAWYSEALSQKPNIPTDPDAASKLERLKADPNNLALLQKEMRDAFHAGMAANR